MKLGLAISLFLLANSAQASNLSCSGGGYNLAATPGDHYPWEKLTLTLNGTVIVANLNENGTSFIQRDETTNDDTQVVRAATVRNGVISSLTLAIKLNPDGGKTGVGTAVAFDGVKTTVISALDCQAP